MTKDKEAEKMIRMALAAVLAIPIIFAREVDEETQHVMSPIDSALEFADELIRKCK